MTRGTYGARERLQERALLLVAFSSLDLRVQVGLIGKPDPAIAEVS
jgi:hypothetical protein